MNRKWTGQSRSGNSDIAKWDGTIWERKCVVADYSNGKWCWVYRSEFNQSCHRITLNCAHHKVESNFPWFKVTLAISRTEMCVKTVSNHERFISSEVCGHTILNLRLLARLWGAKIRTTFRRGNFDDWKCVSPALVCWKRITGLIRI